MELSATASLPRRLSLLNRRGKRLAARWRDCNGGNRVVTAYPGDPLMLHFDQCPMISCAGHGLIRPLVTASGRLVLMCDEDGTVWMHPEDIGSERYAQPTDPDWSVPEGEHIKPGTTRWATLEEVRRAGWEKYLRSASEGP